MALEPTTLSKRFFTTTQTPLFSLPARAQPSVIHISTAAAPPALKLAPAKINPVKSKLATDGADGPNFASIDVEIGRHPELLWAEREDKVYLIVNLADAKDVKVNLDPEGVFTFSGSAGVDDKCYELKLELCGKVDVEESKVSIGAKKIFCILMKDEKKWWNKLLRGDGNSPHFVKVDYKWIDEDDDKALADVDTGGMDFSKFGAKAGGTEQEHDMSDLPDMSDFDDNGFDFAGFGQEGGRTFARFTFRKTAEMLKRMGPEEAKEFETIILDPNNPDDMNKTIYI